MCRINIIMKLKNETQPNIRQVQINQDKRIAENFDLEINLSSSDVLTDKMLKDNLYIYLTDQSKLTYARITESNFSDYVDNSDKLDTTLTFKFKNFSFPEPGKYAIIAFVAKKGLDFPELLETKGSIYATYDFLVTQ